MSFRRFLRRLTGRTEQGSRRNGELNEETNMNFVRGPVEPQNDITRTSTPDGELIRNRPFSANPNGWWEQRLGADSIMYYWRSGLRPDLDPDSWHRNSPVYDQSRLQNILLTPANYALAEDRGSPTDEAARNGVVPVATLGPGVRLAESYEITVWDPAQHVDANYVVHLRTERDLDVPMGLLLEAVLLATQEESVGRSSIQETGEHSPGGGDGYSEGRPSQDGMPQNVITRRRSV